MGTSPAACNAGIASAAGKPPLRPSLVHAGRPRTVPVAHLEGAAENLLVRGLRVALLGQGAMAWATTRLPSRRGQRGRTRPSATSSTRGRESTAVDSCREAGIGGARGLE